GGGRGGGGGAGRNAGPRERWSGGGEWGGGEPMALEQSLGFPAEEVALALETLLARGMVVRSGAQVYAASEWARLREDSLRILADYHQQYPLRLGMPREEWRARLGLALREAGDVLAALGPGEAVEVTAGRGAGQGGARGAYVRLAAHEPRLSPAQERAVAALLDR